MRKHVSYDQMSFFLGRPDQREERDLSLAKEALGQAMRRELTPRQRACVELYYFQGLTEERAAQELGVSKPTVCRHLQKARGRLEKALRYVPR